MKKYLILNTKYFIHDRRSGLTMIELMVVLAITVIISVTSFAAFGNASSSKSVKSALEEMEALLVAARRKSITQESGARWGVRVENTSTTKRLAMFSGSSYASSTPSNFYSTRRNVVITNPISSSTYDVLFDPISGFLSEKKVLTIATLKKDGIIGDVVLNMIGGVTKRFDYGLVGYWHFDEGTGTSTVDATGIGNNGTLTNGPTWQVSANCKAGYCLSFDGVDDQISFPTLVGSFGDFTLVNWQYVTSLASGSWIENFVFGSTSFYTYQSGQFRIVDSTAGCVYPGTFGASNSSDYLNKWSLIAFQRSGSTMNVYVNGVYKASCTSSSGIITNPNIQIGNILSGRNLIGRIDEVRVYNRALSATEILAMYNDLK